MGKTPYLIVVLTMTLLGGEPESWDLRRDFTTARFPDGWRFCYAVPGSNDLRDLIQGSVDSCDGFPVAASWINGDSVEGVRYSSWLMVSVEDAPAWMAGQPETLHPDAIFLHPDQDGCDGNIRHSADVVVEWIAPRAGLIQLGGYARHGILSPEHCALGGGAGLSWSLQHNLIPFGSRDTSYGEEYHFSTLLNVNECDTLQFRCGARGNDDCDHGHLSVRIQYETVFKRGDANTDGYLDVSDGICILSNLFTGECPFRCMDSADTNDSGSLDISDAVRVFTFLFIGAQAPPEPLQCGVDPTEDTLDCVSFAPCE